MSIFKSDNWAKKRLQKHSLNYFYKYYLEPITDKMGEEIHLYSSNDYLTLKDAVKNEAFKNGIINFFFNEKKYKLDAKQLAIGISMGVFGYTKKDFLEVRAYDITEYLVNSIAEKAKKDFAFKAILSSYGKDLSYISLKLDAGDIIDRLRDKKLVLNSYFKKFEQKNGTDIVTIYHPAYGESWIGWKEENTISIRINHQLPKGLILMGFDYKSKFEGNLRQAEQTKKEVLFNPKNSPKGDLIWAS